MKNVTIVGILVVASLLIGCRSATPSTTPSATSSTTSSPIDTVRNGYLESNQTTTIGKALAGTFQNGKWKSFTTEKGTPIVEFDGSEPFSTFSNLAISIQDQILNQQACQANATCIGLLTKIGDYCNSDAGQAQFIKDQQDQHDNLETKIAELTTQDVNSVVADVKGSTNHDKKYFDDQAEELMKLKAQLKNLDDGKTSCGTSALEQHANDPIPVIVQFSINHDGTFQYEANNMGWSEDGLFEKIYN
jgi:hypothetical protein